MEAPRSPLERLSLISRISLTRVREWSERWLTR